MKELEEPEVKNSYVRSWKVPSSWRTLSFRKPRTKESIITTVRLKSGSLYQEILMLAAKSVIKNSLHVEYY